ncbi:hypothetical protein DL766_003569 [Monosporascus sp. MC13-8B]|uniref:Protein kinase domain-containing protein n=1 Tax=Monosporascus cannonballus TaxID=155416 RepID=A0ABY0HCM8_9PEZI|nr:hypothetical protein DL763_006804 [Monosporascus cannonballus]RYO87564.1 hypothetical protein DL762_004210 [Monosporascus cannonballus]RYP33264.1 hypothetical protein DL766_003569 [Monosporascus sp. MC13-8B]
MPIPPDLPPIYFEVRGILLQKICGFKLEDLVSELPDNPIAWEEIIQSAVNAAKEINRAGVIHGEFLPWNIVVARLDEHTFQPFILGFSDSAVKWELEDTDPIDETGEHNMHSFRLQVHMAHDPDTVGFFMVRDVEKATGYKLRVNYD